MEAVEGCAVVGPRRILDDRELRPSAHIAGMGYRVAVGLDTDAWHQRHVVEPPPLERGLERGLEPGLRDP